MHNYNQEQGLNKIPSPQSCPAWLCCLLPCLPNTDGLIRYNQAMADFAEVRRDTVWRKIDPYGVVVGDLVRVSEGNRVPADIRVLEVRCKGNVYCLMKSFKSFVATQGLHSRYFYHNWQQETKDRCCSIRLRIGYCMCGLLVHNRFFCWSSYSHWRQHNDRQTDNV